MLMSPIWCTAQTELEGNFIKATGTGGVAPYTYNIDGGVYQVKDTFFNVSPGTHTINTKDAFGCIKTSGCTMYAPLILTLSATRSSIIATTAGGKTPYKYSKNSTTVYQTSNVFSNLSRRTSYTIRVKDALGYIVTQTISTL